MDDGSGIANGVRFGITEAAHHGDERFWESCSGNETWLAGNCGTPRTRC